MNEQLRFRIHYTVYGYEDTVDMSGPTVADIQEQVAQFKLERGLDTEIHMMWSELLPAAASKE
jgi:hypothetical protein